MDVFSVGRTYMKQNRGVGNSSVIEKVILGFSAGGDKRELDRCAAMNQHFLLSRWLSASPTFPPSFCDWLAGVIDGDGHLRLMKKKYPELVITMGSEDCPLLNYIKNILGTGGITKVQGAKAYRYRISSREGMRKVIQCINGHIRNSVRLPQLRRVCKVLNIPIIEPIALTAQSNWFAGFWDADGTMGIYAPAKRAPELRISLKNKFQKDLLDIERFFGGKIYLNTNTDTHEWVVSSRKDVLRMLQYYNSCQTFKSRKSKRFMLIEEFFKLKDLRAYRTGSPHFHEWLAFLDKWKNFII